MASIAYALSIQHFVNTVGAKAGFAAIIGLALLVLLFFTQSRETANLRRRADEAEQQLYQLQLHLDHLSRQRAPPGGSRRGADHRRPRRRASGRRPPGPGRGDPGDPGRAGRRGRWRGHAHPGRARGRRRPRAQLRHAPHPPRRARRDLDPGAAALHQRRRRGSRLRRHRRDPAPRHDHVPARPAAVHGRRRRQRRRSRARARPHAHHGRGGRARPAAAGGPAPPAAAPTRAPTGRRLRGAVVRGPAAASARCSSSWRPSWPPPSSPWCSSS